MSQPTRACPNCNTPLPGMASYCYVCGSATPTGIDRETGQHLSVGKSGIGPADLKRKLQRALGPGYELLDRIGAGGFAEVFKARDLRLKRDLAVKVLRPDLGLSQEMMQRFRREAETIANLRNPHIVPVYDIGEGEDLAYIIMPFISGESLRAILDRDGAMPLDEVRRILREASSGLASAHEAGVIHRDIKPENIMLEGSERRVLLMDFGIAKAVGGGGDDDPTSSLTTTGIIIGTPQYMSPEQACGDKTIDARSDQYSLAVVAYRMLSGVLPFEGDSTRSVLYKQLVAEPPPIVEKVPGVPPSVAHAIQKALAKEPAERFATMQEFSAMIGAETSIPGASPAAAPAGRRKSSPLGAILLSVVALLAAAVWYATREPKAPQVIGGAFTTVDSAPSATTPPPEAPPETGAAPPSRPADKPGAPRSRRGAPSAATTDRSAGAAGTAAAPVTANAPSCPRSVAAADWVTAATACLKEAEGGSAAAARLLGTMYEKGQGVTKDPAQAVAWYRKASAAGDFEAKFLLSTLVEVGRGTASSPSEATVLLREAAAGGFVKAQQVLAFRLENGAGLRKDESEAAIWYRRLADRGDMLGEQKLGDFLAKGRGVDKNEAEAITWWTKAAEQGSGEAAWQLAQAYFKGRGTAKDEMQGMKWLRKAAGLNQPDALKELKKREG